MAGGVLLPPRGHRAGLARDGRRLSRALPRRPHGAARCRRLGPGPALLLAAGTQPGLAGPAQPALGARRRPPARLGADHARPHALVARPGGLPVRLARRCHEAVRSAPQAPVADGVADDRHRPPTRRVSQPVTSPATWAAISNALVAAGDGALSTCTA